MARSASRESTPAPGVLTQEIKFTPSTTPENREPDDPPSFWEELYRIPEQNWGAEDQKGFKVYLYDAILKGSYLAVIYHPFDIEWVKQNFGGGSYKALLNDASGKIVCREIFSIEGEPRRKPAQSVQNAPAVAQPAGDAVLSQFITILREEQQETRRLLRESLDRNNNAGGGSGAMDPTRQFESMVSLFSTLMGKFVQPVQQQPMGLLEMVALIEKFKGPDLITVLREAREAGIVSGGGAGGSLINQIKELKEAAETLDLGGGKGKSIGEALIEKGPEILQAGAQLIDKYKDVEATRRDTARTVLAIQQQRGAIVTPPPGATPAGAPAANSVGQHVIVGASPGGVSQAAPAPGLEVEAPGTSATPEAIAEAERQDVFIKGKIVEMISDGYSGDEIIDFLDKIDKTICDRFAGASVEEIVFFFNRDPILKKAAALPRFKPAIAEMVEELKAGPDEHMEPVRPN